MNSKIAIWLMILFANALTAAAQAPLNLKQVIVADGVNYPTVSAAVAAACDGTKPGAVFLAVPGYALTGTLTLPGLCTVFGPQSTLEIDFPGVGIQLAGQKNYLVLQSLAGRGAGTVCVLFSPNARAGDSSMNEVHVQQINGCTSAQIEFLPSNGGNVLNNSAYASQVSDAPVIASGIVFASAKTLADEGNHVFSSLTVTKGIGVQFGDGTDSDVAWNSVEGGAHNIATGDGQAPLQFNNSFSNIFQGPLFRERGSARANFTGGANYNVIFSLQSDLGPTAWMNGPLLQNALYGSTNFVPPAIGMPNLLLSSTPPTIVSGFGSGAYVGSNNGAASFAVSVGTGGKASDGVIGMPKAANGWNCNVNNITAAGRNRVDNTRQTNSTTTTVSVQNQNMGTGAVRAWSENDVIRLTCMAF